MLHLLRQFHEKIEVVVDRELKILNLGLIYG